MRSLVLLVRCVSGRGMYSFFQNGQKFPPSIICIFLVFLRHFLIPSVLSICVGDLHGPCVEESPNTPHSRLSLQRHTTQPVLSTETHITQPVLVSHLACRDRLAVNISSFIRLMTISRAGGFSFCDNSSFATKLNSLIKRKYLHFELNIEGERQGYGRAVSYTHLTLPTKTLV